MKIALASASIMGMSSAFLWHFSNILRYGQHVIQEPNIVILWSEIGLLIGVFLFGVYLLSEALRSKDETH